MKEIFRIVKEWFSRDHTRLALGIGIFSAGMAGYSLGILRHLSAQEQPITMTIVPTQEQSVAISQASSSDVNNSKTTTTMNTVISSGTCVFVGSKNSTLYHLPSCAAAKRIKDTNKICFPSKDAAEAKGYKPGCLK
jgi:hypothetical protein